MVVHMRFSGVSTEVCPDATSHSQIDASDRNTHRGESGLPGFLMQLQAAKSNKTLTEHTAIRICHSRLFESCHDGVPFFLDFSLLALIFMSFIGVEEGYRLLEDCPSSRKCFSNCHNCRGNYRKHA
jgi:hypothetical protein